MKVDHLALVLADNSDFAFYHAIKSERQSIYWSGFGSAPDKNRLLEYYMAMLNNENRDTYVLKECHARVGYLCIDKNPLNRTVEISYGVSAQYAGRGLAKVMIRLWLQNVDPVFTTVIAWIAESNIASIKTATAVGLQAADEFEYRHFAQMPFPVKFIKYIGSICS